ncbi:MAG: DUF1269 domain-containing protein [Jaaginema sp. PMC 1079.18]|nr:DUF1269 domain-containing protein [Jaaginema sp. PMC 1080.18]MEC4852436.1 DUF1269 domain-containing protein [Jaaginema sp. PMC 1079.18]MEC4865574.1 DUF1269 domain-containing protein [Jaaginema sp. PMC 1078.18]
MVTAQVQRAVGTFANRREAELALIELRDAGFDMNKISVIARDPEYNRVGGAEVTQSPKEQAKGGAAAGAVAGTATGGVMGLVGSLGILAIPGIGTAVGVGVILASTLLGAGFGAAGGGLIGALIGWGIPEDQAYYYDERVNVYDDYLVIVEGTAAEVHHAEVVLNSRGITNWNTYRSPLENNSTMDNGII